MNGNIGDPEVIVVGGGVAGSAIASVLAEDGRRVVVIERDMSEPNRMLGEGLHPGGQMALEQLGLLDCLDHIDAYRSEEIGIIDPTSGQVTLVPMPMDNTGKRRPLVNLNNGRFVMNLRKAASGKNAKFVEGTVLGMVEEEGRVMGVKYKLKNSEEKQELYAPLTIVADGPFTKFRKQLMNGMADNSLVTTTAYFLGCLVELAPDTDVTEKCHFHAQWSGDVPIYCYRVDSEHMRILSWMTKKPTNHQQFLMDKIYPGLPERFQKAISAGIYSKTLRIRTMPAVYASTASLDKPGVLLLGDALNMRNPGIGMTMVFKDIVIWRELFRGIGSLHDYAAIQAARLEFRRRREAHNKITNTLSECLMKITLTEDRHLRMLQRGAYNYLVPAGGGDELASFVKIWSSIDEKMSVLLYQFLAANLYAVYHLLKSAPWHAKPAALVNIPVVLVKSTVFFLSNWYYA